MPDTTYYDKPALLNRDKHRKLRIRPTPGYAFARSTNSLYLAGVEFNEACKEYPIVFTRQRNGKIAPAAVLGLRNSENLYLDTGDRWSATYIPAFVRRYPFVLADVPGSEQMAVCIDEGFSGLNETEGEALFDDKGADTPFLQNALDFLKRYQVEYLRTEAFCQKLHDLGVLTEMSAKADLVDGRTFTVGGLMVVDEKKLQALPDDKVMAMFRAGELHLVSMHLVSLTNLKRLVDRTAQRAGSAVKQAQAAPAVQKPAA